ncbi:MAG: radical SAM protein [Proteobacteria bacterium]|nr:radical SAM protein [Pseudomonadota bacterium]
MAGKKHPYQGFEQGPIRPPSEAHSLLIRVSRNCPWNRCTFCFVYKENKFSIRPVEHIKNDIDSIHKYVEMLRGLAHSDGNIYRGDIERVAGTIDSEERDVFNAALNWLANGMTSVFIQDANSLVIRPAYLVEILTHLRKRFPWIERITSYARSHSLARIKDDDFKKIKEAGLNRIHVGLETGSDKILKMVDKGATKELHIKGGRNVKNAGIELSEYIMPGLGGQRLSEMHALETADTLNQIDADFIRLRTLTIPEGYPLFGDDPDVPFEKSTDLRIAQEILHFIEALEGITSTVKSDHMNNLLQTVEGTLPDDKEPMADTVREFLEFDPMKQVYFQVGRRFGFLYQPSDLEKPNLLARSQEICEQLGITPDNSDRIIDQHVSRHL